MPSFKITTEDLTLDTIQSILSTKSTLELSDDSLKLIMNSREYLDKKLANSSEAFYGINTGFGSLYNQRINNEDLHKLQNHHIL